MRRSPLFFMLVAACALVSLIYSFGLVQYFGQEFAALDQQYASAILEEDPRETLSLIGFIRVPKTGSTSLLTFLSHRENGLLPWKDFFYSTTDFLEETRSRGLGSATLCVHGPAAVAASMKHDHRDRRNAFKEKGIVQCPHVRLSQLQNQWNKTVPYWTDPNADYSTFKKASVQYFTIVRDPFDRLRSLFFYVRRFCKRNDQFWNWKFWEYQYDLLCDGDFSGWLESLSTQKKRKSFDVPNQFPYFDEDVDRAIARIEGDSPEVIVLLNECFEESLRFLEDKFDLTPGATDDFINSTVFHKNHRNGTDRIDDDEESVLGKLRELSKVWFSDDYKFYNAAVAQFKRQVAPMNLEPPLLKNPCIHLTKE